MLKAHIAIERLVFPAGYSGPQLDAVARSQMWALGYNYGHGTGHGVGAAMNVHEGPISFGNRGITSGVPFEPGMVISDEPGYYKTGGFGIRIENCVTVREAFENENGRFLGFEPLTLAPIETKLVEVSLLSDQELEWLNGYHAHVLEKVLPLLEGEDARWLAGRAHRKWARRVFYLEIRGTSGHLLGISPPVFYLYPCIRFRELRRRMFLGKSIISIVFHA